jgi:hypothetical protein
VGSTTELTLLSWNAGTFGPLEEIILNEQKDYKRGRRELKNSIQSSTTV